MELVRRSPPINPWRALGSVPIFKRRGYGLRSWVAFWRRLFNGRCNIQSSIPCGPVWLMGRVWYHPYLNVLEVFSEDARHRLLRALGWEYIGEFD